MSDPNVGKRGAAAGKNENENEKRAISVHAQDRSVLGRNNVRARMMVVHQYRRTSVRNRCGPTAVPIAVERPGRSKRSKHEKALKLVSCAIVGIALPLGRRLRVTVAEAGSFEPRGVYRAS